MPESLQMRPPLRFRIHVLSVLLGLFFNVSAEGTERNQQTSKPAQLKVFLDCENCYADFLRSEIEFVEPKRKCTC